MSDFHINTQYLSLLVGENVSWPPITYGTTFAVFASEKWIAKVNTGASPRLRMNLEVPHRCPHLSFLPSCAVYDDHTLTPYEVCILKRLPGENWAKIILSQTKGEVISLWEEMLDMAHLFWENSQSPQKTFVNDLRHLTTERIRHLKEQHPVWSEDLDRIDSFVKEHADLFVDSPCGFVHPDLHPGNILCDQGHLTGMVDFDDVYSGPQEGFLLTILSFLERPWMFIPSAIADFSSSNFSFLYSTVKKAYADIWDPPVLIRKLNLLFIHQSLGWMMERLSSSESQEFLKVILQRELPQREKDDEQTYFARLIKRLEK